MKFTKRIFSIVLCILILLSVACMSVSAKVTYVSGSFIYEKINNYSEIEIDKYTGSDTFDITYYSYNDLPITTIGEDAFSGNTTLETLWLSGALKYINRYAFLNATGLKDVSCKSSLEFIDDNAFFGCTSLATINLQDTVITEVSNSCFYNCDSLTEIMLPETVTKIDDRAFAECDSLSKIIIPTSVIEISNTAFENSENTVIYCYTDSAAHIYAETNSIEYVLIDAEPVRTYMLGDIDDDGEISVMDATRIQLILVELYKNYTEEDVIRGDVEKDGVLSIMDVTSIQRYSASFDDGLGIGETFEF